MATQRTKKPHYVPASYLQYWSIGSKRYSRTSKIYVCDGKTSWKTKAENIALEHNLYSLKDPNSAEKFFLEFEGDWVKLVNKLSSGKGPKKDILAPMLLVQSSVLLLRNPNFSNESSEERIDIYKKAIDHYLREVLMEASKLPEKVEDKDEDRKVMLDMIKQINKAWSSFILIAQDEPWITSDNPVLTLNTDKSNPSIIFLPITPGLALIAINNKAIKLTSSNITAKDTETLNTYTTINCNRFVFSNKEFEESDIKITDKWINLRPKLSNYMDDELIHMDSIRYPIKGSTKSMDLSFIEII